LEEISSQPFTVDSASGIVPLTADEVARIERLPKEEVPLLAPVRAVARIEGEDVARTRAAPPPTTQRTGVMHVRRAPAYTYAMKVQKKGEKKAPPQRCSKSAGHSITKSVRATSTNHPFRNLADFATTPPSFICGTRRGPHIEWSRPSSEDSILNAIHQIAKSFPELPMMRFRQHGVSI
jgi:hypothetical protein